MPRVGIVILNWKRPNDTRACLQSLAKLTYPAYEIVVVDNGDTLGQPQRLSSEFPTVHIIENGRNLGFAGGTNVGVRHLMASGVDYVCLLNDDTEVDSEFLTTLVEVAEQHPEAGIVGPKICYFAEPGVVWFAGGRVNHLGEPSHLGVDTPDDLTETGLVDVDYVTGCCMLVRRAVVEQVGVLDERFFAYFEETEWCARAAGAGFRVCYVPQARIWHKIDMGVRTTSALYLYLMTRNRLLFLRARGSDPATIAMAILDLLRTVASWTLKPRFRDMRPFAPVLLHGVSDFLLGRFGRPRAYLS